MQRGLLHRGCQNVSLLLFRCSSMKEAMAAGAKRPSKARMFKKIFAPKGATAGTVDVYKGMSLTELAKAMQVPDKEVLRAVAQVCPDDFTGVKQELKKTLPNMALFHKVASTFEYGVRYTKNEEEKSVDKDAYPQPPAPAASLKPRAPVVTIMGHVDHGKTTLLDALRESRIVDAEFGGITQHIGAFSVTLHSLAHKPCITFLDTPGHAAFSAMRQRGANVTDIVVLVVAADDGVMPQTQESIRYATAARVPIIVAVNKIDSPKADVDTVLNELVVHTPLVPETHGGDVQCVPISALKRTNLDHLQEAIVAQAEIMDLKAAMEGAAEAVVVEAHSEKGKGKIATCLVRRGCLKNGATLVAGTAVCRVRAMYDEMGKRVSKAQPSDPIQVAGWRDLPTAGDLVLEVKNEARANEVQRYRESLMQSDKRESDMLAYQESMSSYRKRYDEWRGKLMERGYNKRTKLMLMKDHYPDRDLAAEGDGPAKLHILVKGDVHGSVEAIVHVLGQIQSSKLFELCIVSTGVGEVSEGDIELAEAFEAIIYAFNISAGPKTREVAEQAGVEIRDFNVIYHLAHDIRDQILSIIPEETKLEFLGSANVLQIFMVTKEEGTRTKVPVAGCFCDAGLLRHDAIYRILRDTHQHNDQKEDKAEEYVEARENGCEEVEDEDAADDAHYTVIFEGPCYSMYHKKEKVTSIKKNSECGLQFTTPDGDFLELRLGDRIECYEETKYQPVPDIEFDFE